MSDQTKRADPDELLRQLNQLAIEEPDQWTARCRVMARSYLKELRDNGLTDDQIIQLAATLGLLATNDAGAGSNSDR